MNKVTCISFMVYPMMEDRTTTAFFHRRNGECKMFCDVTKSSWMRLHRVLGGRKMSECYMFSNGGFDIRYNFKEKKDGQ